VLPKGTRLKFKKHSLYGKGEEKKRVELPPEKPLPLGETCSLILPREVSSGRSQFARTPYVASFQANWLKLHLATVHIYYGEGKAGMQKRIAEIHHLTRSLEKKAKALRDADPNAQLLLLGDFNIVDKKHKTMEALESHNFEVPDEIKKLPRSNVGKEKKFYDQIALYQPTKNSADGSYSGVQIARAGVFDFFEHVFHEEELEYYKSKMVQSDGKTLYAQTLKGYRGWRTHQMSDHLPMWVELRMDFTDGYLNSLEEKLTASSQE